MKSGPAAIAQPGIAYLWQINPSFGGPIMKDKLWFYATYKYEDNKTYVASSAFADGSTAYRQSMGNYSGIGRVTWQASQRDKVRFYLEKQFNGEFYNGFNTLPTTTPEASTDAWGRGWVPQVKWTQTTSNKLLLEAGITYYDQPYEQTYTSTVGPRDLPRLEQTTGPPERGRRQYDSAVYAAGRRPTASMASASYITGSHAFKGGMTMNWGKNSRTFSSNAQINTLVFNNAPPRRARRAPPTRCRASRCPVRSPSSSPTARRRSSRRSRATSAFFVQDTWTMNKLTLNLGARFDTFNAIVPAESAAGQQLDPGAQLRRDPQRAELERLVGPVGRRLRPLRQRQDRDQGQRQQVHRGGRGGLRPDLQRR